MKTTPTAVLLLLLSSFGFSQTDPLRNQLNSVFANVDKSQIPTGFLQEFGVPLVPLDVYNGVLTDSNKVDITAWRMVYSSMQTSRIYGSNPLPTTAIVNGAISNAETANPGLLVVPMLLIDYNYLRPDAITANLLSVSNNQFYDVAGRTQSPYYSRVAFAATPSVSYAATGSPSFIFKPELYYNVSSKVLTLINVDFGDGRGYLNVTWNTPIAAAYTATGTYTAKIKLIFTDNSFTECYTPFQVTQVSQFAAQSFYAGGAQIQSFPPVSGVHSGGKVYYQISTNNASGKIVKPLIVAEGYDVSNIAPLLQINYSYSDFINQLSEPVGYNFNYQLDNIASYDLVFLDYANGTDDITRNADLLKDVIIWVNQQKALSGSTQKNVVMGVSMGGLVARYCLANMTKQGIDPQTRLLLTHDSPHRGANTPIGFQFLTRGLNETVIVQNLNSLDLIPQISQANALLDAPATSQMLILRATTSSTYLNNSFLDSNYRDMITFPSNGPQPTYTIEATSLGSECGMGSLSPGTQLLHVSGHFFISRIPWISRNSFNTDIVVNALPAYGASQTLMSLHLWVNYRILYYISVIVDLTNKAAGTPPNSLPWDGAPGGTQNVAQQAGSRIPSSNYQFGPFFNLSLNSTYAGDFCFVPTVSALDVTTLNTAALASSYVGGTSPTNQARVANFIAQERFVNGSINYYNQAHPRFTPRNAQWMYNEMESPTGNNLNCSSDCQIDYGGSISGPSIVCSANSTFTVNNLPASVTSVSWSRSSNLNYYSGQGTINYTVNSNATGSGYVSVTPSGSCGPGKMLTKNLTVGTGAPPTFITIGRDDCWDQRFSTDFAGGASVYTWTIINAANHSSTYYPNHNYQLITGLGGGNYSVVVASACPSATALSQNFTVTCTGGSPSVAVTPNPANSQLIISSTSESAAAPQTQLQVTLIDESGSVVRSAELTEGHKIELNLVGLKKGAYFLHIKRENEIDSRHILIE